MSQSPYLVTPLVREGQFEHVCLPRKLIDQAEMLGLWKECDFDDLQSQM